MESVTSPALFYSKAQGVFQNTLFFKVPDMLYRQEDTQNFREMITEDLCGWGGLHEGGGRS